MDSLPSILTLPFLARRLDERCQALSWFGRAWAMTTLSMYQLAGLLGEAKE
jgi:hypothetical protein